MVKLVGYIDSLKIDSRKEDIFPLLKWPDLGLQFDQFIFWSIKETKTATMNIFEKFSFLFKSFVKTELI